MVDPNDGRFARADIYGVDVPTTRTAKAERMLGPGLTAKPTGTKVHVFLDQGVGRVPEIGIGVANARWNWKLGHERFVDRRKLDSELRFNLVEVVRVH